MTRFDPVDIALYAPSTYVKDGQLGDHFIVGAAGSGKTSLVLALVLDKLMRGEPVVILDSGRNYLLACRLLDGAYVELRDSEQVQTLSGTAPLTVFDFAGVTQPYGRAPDEVNRFVGRPDGLLVVDDTANLERLQVPVRELLRDHVGTGGNFCVTGQLARDVAAFRGISTQARMVTLTRA